MFEAMYYSLCVSVKSKITDKDNFRDYTYFET